MTHSVHFFLLWLALIGAPLMVSADTVSLEPMYIDQLLIHGNKVTKEKLVKLYLNIDSGSVIDSSVLQKAKSRLIETGLFTKVELIPLKKERGYQLHVILTERFYIIPDAGGGYFRYKHGKEQLWFRFSISADHTNFRGAAEKLKVSVGFWDWRNIAVSWTKPFLPSQYSIILGASGDFYPSQTKKVDHLQSTGKIILSKALQHNSKIAFGLIPTRETQKSNDPSLTTIHSSELFSIIGWETDFRKRQFNTSDGWYFYSDIKSNHLYHSNTPGFLQLNIESRLYHRGFFEQHSFAWRVCTALRNKDGGPIHNLGLGGNKSVRGYLQPIIGSSINGNNTLQLSAEYRFPIVQLPLMSVPFFAKLSSSLDPLDIRVHGALIADFGRVSETATDLFSVHSNRIQSGTGIGAGVRILVPAIEICGSIDVVFPEDIHTPRNQIQFRTIPELHLYFNFPY